jgi:WhiB family redox-sensing transcriptional regulator
VSRTTQSPRALTRGDHHQNDIDIAAFLEGLATELADPDGEDWQERALCAQTDPEAFFPEKGGSTRAAKHTCFGCPVKNECLEYALARDERFGIWGGLSERERRALKRRNRS